MSTRDQFESAWRTEYPLHGSTTFQRSGFNPDAYAGTRVQDGWLMWQASRRAALEETKAVADMARAGYSAAGLTQHAAGAWCVHEEIRALAASDSEGGKSE